VEKFPTGRQLRCVGMMVEHLQQKYQKKDKQWAKMMDSMTQKKFRIGFSFEKRSWPIHLMRIACYIWQRNITYQIR
jgi:hypothetical protein